MERIYITEGVKSDHWWYGLRCSKRCVAKLAKWNSAGKASVERDACREKFVDSWFCDELNFCPRSCQIHQRQKC